MVTPIGLLIGVHRSPELRSERPQQWMMGPANDLNCLTIAISVALLRFGMRPDSGFRSRPHSGWHNDYHRIHKYPLDK